MTFKDRLFASLPKGTELIRMYSLGETRTVVETCREGVPRNSIMAKISINDLFNTIPFMVIEEQTTHNEIYEYLSKKYSLGLVHGLDYLDDEIVVVGEERTYVQLSILNDSPGYYGSFGCYLVKQGTTLATSMTSRELTGFSQEELNQTVKVKTTLSGTLLQSSGEYPLFDGCALSVGMVELIMSVINKVFPAGQTVFSPLDLYHGNVIDLINDGISDIAVFKTGNDKVIFLRFSSSLGDLPVITLKETEDGNILDETSQEDLSGMDDNDLEKTGEEREETITGKEELTLVNDILIPSLLLGGIVLHIP